MITIQEADRLILDNMPRAATEPCALQECAGRMLCESVRADRPLPPYDRVIMDGMAIDYDDWLAGCRTFTMEGLAPAGAPRHTLREKQHAIEVCTGTVLPNGCDTVVPVEEITRDGDAWTLTGTAPIARGDHIHPCGSDSAAGEELIGPGIRLNAAHIAICASVGQLRVSVARRPSIGIISTGDEIVEPDHVPAEHQVRSSNMEGLCALLAAHGVPAAGRHHVSDRAEDTREALGSALDRHEVLLITGGVSKGRRDIIPETLAALGVEKLFHGVRQRAGKPMWFGMRAADQRVVFGLPGNPVSSMTVATRHVVPALHFHLGGSPASPAPIPLRRPVEPLDGFTHLLPARLITGGDLAAEPLVTNTSGDFATLAQADGFLEIPPAGTQTLNRFPFFPITPFPTHGARS
jgi:molybdopterin molybdotransferase